MIFQTFLELHISGPSQEFDWVGHGYTGNSVPLTIPNIFKAAGIDTKWDPVSNKVFETGMVFEYDYFVKHLLI